jgi:pyruvate/2-oxoglutarate dehydrogenase complex dihydrolipoamide dehydrogenase (E3) component
MTETQARQSGRQVRIARMPMSKVARALEMDESRGILKVVVDSESERILGVAALAVEGGELASALQIAMMGDLPYTALRDATFAHPTLVESFNNLFFSFDE